MALRAIAADNSQDPEQVRQARKRLAKGAPLPMTSGPDGCVPAYMRLPARPHHQSADVAGSQPSAAAVEGRIARQWQTSDALAVPFPDRCDHAERHTRLVGVLALACSPCSDTCVLLQLDQCLMLPAFAACLVPESARMCTLQPALRAAVPRSRHGPAACPTAAYRMQAATPAAGGCPSLGPTADGYGGMQMICPQKAASPQSPPLAWSGCSRARRRWTSILQMCVQR
jgi:hypothetical protein